jgi:hypothetical protein
MNLRKILTYKSDLTHLVFSACRSFPKKSFTKRIWVNCAGIVPLPLEGKNGKNKSEYEGDLSCIELHSL